LNVDKKEISSILSAITFPLILVLSMWAFMLYAVYRQNSFIEYGLMPRNLSGLTGIVSAVFIHADWKHLFNNSVPLLILGWALFYFYREVAWKVVIWVVLMGGLWTWISAREAHHVGASGLVYGLFSFLLFSGFIRKNKQLISISFLVAFLYGSLVWGLLPIDYKMSWESHFWGFLAGFVLAVYYRKIGTQASVHIWDEEEEAALENMDYWKSDVNRQPPIRIIFKKKEDSDQA
jgi:membrane associated rhomboid family serine protease